MRDTFKTVTALTAIVSMVGFVFYVGYLADQKTDSTASRNCMKRWAQSEIRSQYDPHVGCMVHTKQGWVPEDRFRVSE